MIHRPDHIQLQLRTQEIALIGHFASTSKCGHIVITLTVYAERGARKLQPQPLGFNSAACEIESAVGEKCPADQQGANPPPTPPWSSGDHSCTPLEGGLAPPGASPLRAPALRNHLSGPECGSWHVAQAEMSPAVLCAATLATSASSWHSAQSCGCGFFSNPLRSDSWDA